MLECNQSYHIIYTTRGCVTGSYIIGQTDVDFNVEENHAPWTSDLELLEEPKKPS